MNTPELLTNYLHEYQVNTPQPIYVFPFGNGYMTPDLLYNRRDFYQIRLCTTGSSRFLYGGKEFLIEKPSLILCNWLTAYSCNPITPVSGFFCLFTADFLHGPGYSASLQGAPLFKLGTNPVFVLSDSQCDFITQIFRQMLAEVNSTYRYKFDLLRTHLQLLLHETLRLQPELQHLTTPSPANRLATQFIELLEEQFPIQSPDRPLSLTTAEAFAAQLGIHVNHLNRTLREVTGRTTSAHLTGRVAQEAKVLLRYSDWSIADIADSLGFANATYFNHFFRRHAGTSPKNFRQQAIGGCL